MSGSFDKPHQSPIRIKAFALRGSARPWRNLAPQKTFGSRQRSMCGNDRTCGLNNVYGTLFLQPHLAAHRGVLHSKRVALAARSLQSSLDG